MLAEMHVVALTLKSQNITSTIDTVSKNIYWIRYPQTDSDPVLKNNIVTRYPDANSRFDFERRFANQRRVLDSVTKQNISCLFRYPLKMFQIQKQMPDVISKTKIRVAT